VWLPAWLPAALDAWLLGVLVLVTITDLRRCADRTTALPRPLPVLGRHSTLRGGSGRVICQPEKRKVGSSTLPLTTKLLRR
jgi:hypothetical protein